jgi:predicted type IV restriction endonuclease
MAGLFGDFDFTLLDDPEFGEDAVREELVVPLLAALGYTASPPDRIIRSRKLEHPFVLFGTVRKGITIIPDYLLERDGAYAWVLDAKGPGENIDTGKNVEQAYSYAMHRHSGTFLRPVQRTQACGFSRHARRAGDRCAFAGD